MAPKLFHFKNFSILKWHHVYFIVNGQNSSPNIFISTAMKSVYKIYNPTESYIYFKFYIQNFLKHLFYFFLKFQCMIKSRIESVINLWIKYVLYIYFLQFGLAVKLQISCQPKKKFRNIRNLFLCTY